MSKGYWILFILSKKDFVPPIWGKFKTRKEALNWGKLTFPGNTYKAVWEII